MSTFQDCVVLFERGLGFLTVSIECCDDGRDVNVFEQERTGCVLSARLRDALLLMRLMIGNWRKAL